MGYIVEVFKIEGRLKWELEMYADKLREKLNDLDAKGYDIISVSPMKELGNLWSWELPLRDQFLDIIRI